MHPASVRRQPTNQPTGWIDRRPRLGWSWLLFGSWSDGWMFHYLLPIVLQFRHHGCSSPRRSSAAKEAASLVRFLSFPFPLLFCNFSLFDCKLYDNTKRQQPSVSAWPIPRLTRRELVVVATAAVLVVVVHRHDHQRRRQRRQQSGWTNRACGNCWPGAGSTSWRIRIPRRWPT